MMKFHVDKGSHKGYIYQQIYEKLREFILEHTLSANQKLPSKRDLAIDLGVSINSVAAAYEQLLEEGYIYTLERKGHFVENISYFMNNTSTYYELPTYLKETSMSEQGWLSFSHIQTDVTKFPFHEWVKCQEKAIQHHKNEFSEITHSQGPLTVRKTIRDLITLTRGVTCEPEQIVINTGSHLLINHLMTMQPSNQKIAVENPGYFRIYQLLKSQQLDVSPIQLDKDGVNIKEIETEDPNFLFITPSHQFPTGKIMPISRRIELLNWAGAKEGRYIIEDDYDSEFKYVTDNIPSLQSLDHIQRVVYFGAFSKTLLPGLRISYMVLPPDLLELYRHYYGNWIHGCSTLELYTLHYFIQSGEYAKHVKRMNQYYHRKRKLLIAELRERFQDNIYIYDIPAGLHFLAAFKTSKSYDKVCEMAVEEKLEIYTFQHYLLNQNINYPEDILITIGFANIEEESISEAVDRLYRVIH